MASASASRPPLPAPLLRLASGSNRKCGIGSWGVRTACAAKSTRPCCGAYMAAISTDEPAPDWVLEADGGTGG